jgi:hypothetical protein
VGRTNGARHWWQRGIIPEPIEKKSEVLDQCERFLGGDLLNEFPGGRESAPDWVWINVLAHGSEAYLTACASRGVQPGPANRCMWDRTLSFLSAILLDHAARTHSPVAELQRTVIVPLELLQGPGHHLAPPTFVRLVLTGLNEYRPVPDHEAPTSVRRP